MKSIPYRILFLLLMTLPFFNHATAQNDKLIGTWKGSYVNYFHGRIDVEVTIDYVDSAWSVRETGVMHKYSSTPNVINCYDISQDDNILRWFHKSRTVFEKDDEMYSNKGWGALDSYTLVQVEYKGGTLHYVNGLWHKYVTYGIDAEIINQDIGPENNPALIDETILYKVEREQQH